MNARKNLSPEIQSEFSNVEAWFKKVHFFENDFAFGSELKDKLKERIEKPENLIGEGGVGSVIDMGNGVCVKLMENRENSPHKDMMDLGNNPKIESEFQAKLDGFVSEGVFSPRVYGYYIGERGAAIIMEKLNAVNLQEIMAGKESLPENFNTNDFFTRLEGYIQDVHAEKKMAHCDLYARNIMVDRETGLPLVIDFGRAVNLKGKDPTTDKMAERDLKLLEDLQDKVTTYVSKHLK